eukprot:scaffold24405_cov60-Phaeocystis_antarctica.AAC.6
MYFRRSIICCCHDPARPSAGAAGVPEEEEGGARVKLESTGCSAEACLMSSCMKAGAERARSSGTPGGGARGAADGGASSGGASGGGASGGGASGGGAAGGGALPVRLASSASKACVSSAPPGATDMKCVSASARRASELRADAPAPLAPPAAASWPRSWPIMSVGGARGASGSGGRRSGWASSSGMVGRSSGVRRRQRSRTSCSWRLRSGGKSMGLLGFVMASSF